MVDAYNLNITKNKTLVTNSHNWKTDYYHQLKIINYFSNIFIGDNSSSLLKDKDSSRWYLI